ncbi:MAG: segregation/condensation protein A [Planctomycetes bacterium]|nr:segregation/condensation protein A [Planctomycetota bacterium]
MSEYYVNLDRFYRGPLDLLLHLVREREVEISYLSIARLADDYARYVESLMHLDVNQVGEYLVLASTLAMMKSKVLLPRTEVDIEEDLGPDDELILKLIEYKRFRELTNELSNREVERSLQFERGQFDETETIEEIEIAELSPWDLLNAFGKVLRATKPEVTHTIGTRTKPLREYVFDLLEVMTSGVGRHSFREVLKRGPGDRITMVGLFFAILELARQGVLAASQPKHGDDIELTLRIDDPEAARDQVLFALEVGRRSADQDPFPEASEETDEERSSDGSTPAGGPVEETSEPSPGEGEPSHSS